MADTDGRAPAPANQCVFKDLCIDVSDPDLMAPFWAAVLGLDAEALDNGAYVLRGALAEHTVWINPVPEPKTVKQRTHLDVLVAEVAALQEIGARVVAELPRWTVLSDPEGGELCAFVRSAEQLSSYRLMEIVVDAARPEAIATWWGDRLGAPPRRGDEASWWLEKGTGNLAFDWGFQAVVEPKTVKNRIHWDVLGETSELLAWGARLLRARGGDIAWDVLADPEGNEFCVFPCSL